MENARELLTLCNDWHFSERGYVYMQKRESSNSKPAQSVILKANDLSELPCKLFYNT